MGAMRRDGLGREVVLAMVHDDGHVAACANMGTGEDVVRAVHALLMFTGVQGFRLDNLAPEDATVRYMAGQTCRRCVIVFPCGCSWTRVGARQCPHGTADRSHRYAHLIGYCANDAPAHYGAPIPTWTRVYRATGARHAHLREDVGATGRVLCVRILGANAYNPDEWYGTGSQREYDVAAKLPLCARCVDIATTAPYQSDGTS